MVYAKWNSVIGKFTLKKGRALRSRDLLPCLALTYMARNVCVLGLVRSRRVGGMRILALHAERICFHLGLRRILGRIGNTWLLSACQMMMVMIMMKMTALLKRRREKKILRFLHDSLGVTLRRVGNAPHYLAQYLKSRQI